MEQISLFPSQEEQESLDIRAEQQLNRKVSYDVGEKIGNSRKDQAALKKQFLEDKSIDVLTQIESASAVLAAELISKQELFADFSLEKERDLGVDCMVARLKQLVIQRVVSQPADEADSRKDFFKASQELMKRMNNLYTWDEFESFIKVMNNQLRYEGSSGEYTEKRIATLKEEISNADTLDPKECEELKRNLQKAEIRLKDINEANLWNFSVLGESFKNFFTKQQSINSTIKAASKIKSWDDLLSPKKSKSGRKTNKPVWERSLPDRPDRVGGREIKVTNPENMLRTFSFRGIEFGVYVNDQKGLEHIFRCSEALLDLAEILEISEYSISLNSTLGLAFGARGRGGNALGTYEPGYKVINFTKERGTLGITAHEWFHALDNYLFDHSHQHKNGQFGYLSNLEGYGITISTGIVNAMKELMEEIREGSSLAYFSNDNKPEASWRLSYSLKDSYQRENGDLLSVMTKYKNKLDESYSYHVKMLSFIEREKGMEKLEKRLQRDLKKYAQALAWYHEQQTGERVEEIPYPSNKSQYFQQAIHLDRGKVNKYWSKGVELAARAFEAYIEDKLTSMGRKNDYLVCGTRDASAFPCGEEREAINHKFGELFKQIEKVHLL
ncbi:LPD1 domain-containing protein [Bacillus sp. AFS040349]|uniref:LPD1 domain-containing protein n=1 Tax=Bacillus sp. AFS040349 TaxID=2033502 RepID=UPI000BFBEB93|nr:LPD1 domain-containing protein [Bacillus sp. AFS040349]PGT83261.1 hypothetical protein COD11_13075 [Bacillus sp. AFS040349]